MHGAARPYPATVVVQQRLEAQADAEDGNGAQGGINKLHHAASVARVAGAWGKDNNIGLGRQHLRDGDAVAVDGGAVTGEGIDEVIDKGIVVIEQDHVR